MSVSPHITLLATGGTIACTADSTRALHPTRNGIQLSHDAGLDLSHICVHDILQLDSSEMTLEDLDLLLNSIHDALGTHTGALTPIVVTHGTDSMEETAMAVDRLLGGPIILTGAQRPADDPDPDGPQNLRDAIDAASFVKSPAVVFGGDVVPAYGVRKIHTTADQAFSAPAIPAERPASLQPHGTPPAPLSGLRVDILSAYQGADATLVDASLAAGSDGLVIEAFGSGNVGALAPGIRRALASRVPVVICSRVPNGPTSAVYGGTGGGATLATGGARVGGYLSPAQARMELLCQLAVSRQDYPADLPG